MNQYQSLYLDILRVLAAQLVVVGHSIAFFYSGGKYHFIQESSVLVFFILSGLVISYSVKIKQQRNNLYNFKEFFIERFARIYSGLIPSLIFILLIDLIHIYYFSFPYNVKYDFDILAFLGNIFMLQNYPYLYNIVSIGPFGSGRPLWSLSIEWWLYMAYGIVIFYYTKQFVINKLLYLVAILIVPVYYILGGTGNGLTMYWLMGVIIMLLSFNKNTIFDQKSSFFFTILSMLLGTIWIYDKGLAYHPIFASIFGFFIFFSLNLLGQIRYTTDVSKSKNIIHFFAAYSLTLYLIHYSILDLMRNFMNSENKFTIMIFSILLSNILACCLALKTEMKYKILTLKLKKIFLQKEIIC